MDAQYTTTKELPDEQVRRLLAEMHETIDKVADDIQAIAKDEVERLGEDTPEGRAWYAFGGAGFLCDMWRAADKMQWEIAAVRGKLTYRQLDSSHKDYAPLNQQTSQAPREAERESD